MPDKLNLQYGDQDGSQRTSMTKVYLDLKLIHCLQLIVLLTVKYFDKLKMWNTNLHVLLRDQTLPQQAQQKRLSSVKLTKKVHQCLFKKSQEYDTDQVSTGKSQTETLPYWLSDSKVDTTRPRFEIFL